MIKYTKCFDPDGNSIWFIKDENQKRKAVGIVGSDPEERIVLVYHSAEGELPVPTDLHLLESDQEEFEQAKQKALSATQTL